MATDGANLRRCENAKVQSISDDVYMEEKRESNFARFIIRGRTFAKCKKV